MKHYSSTMPTVFVQRKIGYYPSHKVADKMAKAACWVLQLNSSQFPYVRDYLKGNHEAYKALVNRVTPSEYQQLFKLSDWFSGDIASETMITYDQPTVDDPLTYYMDMKNLFSSFVLADLNTGRAYCFLSRIVVNPLTECSTDEEKDLSGGIPTEGE